MIIRPHSLFGAALDMQGMYFKPRGTPIPGFFIAWTTLTFKKIEKSNGGAPARLVY